MCKSTVDTSTFNCKCDQEALEDATGLKQCPFCGGESLYIDEQILKGEPPLFFVVCRKCECEGPCGESGEEAETKWNERQDPAAGVMSKFIGYVMTCRKENQAEWMEGLAEAIDKICPEFNDRQGHYFDGDGIKFRG